MRLERAEEFAVGPRARLAQSRRPRTSPSPPSAARDYMHAMSVKPTSRPHWFWVHGALVLTQVMFGAGGVIGKLGLPATNPLLFALLREGCAGPILLAAAHVWTPTRVGDVVREWREFALLGLFIFGNQVSFIVGLKLSNPVAGAIWQPSQPIFTAVLAIWLGMEKPSARRLAGIGVAFVGCAAMVYLSASSVGVGSSALVDEIAGNCFFFVNCLATSLYVIRSKPLLRRFPALAVTAWSYMVAALFMAVTAVALNSSRAALDFLCKDCGGDAWRVPEAALLALAYWILFQSVGAYALMTWGNVHASASLVSAYTVLQPVTSSLLTALILASGAYRNCARADDDDACLSMPGVGDLGAIGVVIGLYLVITSEVAPPKSAPPAADQANPLLDGSDDDDRAPDAAASINA